MVVTEEGMISEVKPEQPSKAEAPIHVIEEGMIREPPNPEQPENAVLPIEVTEEGMVREPVRFEQP
jgi:hypothetical protein